MPTQNAMRPVRIQWCFRAAIRLVSVRAAVNTAAGFRAVSASAVSNWPARTACWMSPK